MAATAESSTANGNNFEQCYNEINSFSLKEQLSFAKDNCATVKSDSLLLGYKCSEGSASTSFPWPKASRRR
ncbi:unnamed protein product [Wuchereria bancrofti]|nr:unnamed protein product [Wuchereria bancrofti]